MDKKNPDTSGKNDKDDKNENLQALLDAYVASLSPLAKKGLEIARSHLESSFSLEKSIGFMEFVKSKEK